MATAPIAFCLLIPENVGIWHARAYDDELTFLLLLLLVSFSIWKLNCTLKWIYKLIKWNKSSSFRVRMQTNYTVIAKMPKYCCRTKIMHILHKSRSIDDANTIMVATKYNWFMCVRVEWQVWLANCKWSTINLKSKNNSLCFSNSWTLTFWVQILLL